MNLSMVEITFKVQLWFVTFISLQKNTDYDTFISKVYAEVRIGEEIRVSGNAPVLGCNDPNRAIPMFTTPHDFPWWRSKEGNQINVKNSDFCIRICSSWITIDARLTDFAHHSMNPTAVIKLSLNSSMLILILATPYTRHSCFFARGRRICHL